MFSLYRHLYMFHLNDAKQKFQHPHLYKNKFLIHYWIQLSSNWPHTMIVSLCPYLIPFSCWSVCAGSHFPCVNLISMSRFLTILSKTLSPVSIHFFFFCFVVHFLFSRDIALSFFLSWRFYVFFGQPICFFLFFNTSFLLYLLTI